MGWQGSNGWNEAEVRGDTWSMEGLTSGVRGIEGVGR